MNHLFLLVQEEAALTGLVEVAGGSTTATIVTQLVSTRLRISL